MFLRKAGPRWVRAAHVISGSEQLLFAVAWRRGRVGPPPLGLGSCPPQGPRPRQAAWGRAALGRRLGEGCLGAVLGGRLAGKGISTIS